MKQFPVIVALVMTAVNPVAFTTVHRGSDSQVEDAKNATVRTVTEWRALWKEHSFSLPLPKVDFTKEMVVGVFLGMRPTGGHSVTITAIELVSVARSAPGAAKNDELVVTYRVEAPAPNTMVTQALTSPVHLVRLPQHKGTVRFERVTQAAEPKR
jgi:hypothetical protein